MTRTSKLAYLAGFLDTDGFVGVDDGIIHKREYCIRTGITSRKVCKWLQLHFGGNFHRVPREDGTKVYYWKLTGSQAVPSLLKELLNFLRRNHTEALDVLEVLNALPDVNIPGFAMNRREIAGYQAGHIDAKGFEGKVPFEPEDGNLERFFLSVIPYLVERKQQVNGLLQTFRSTATTITPDTK